MTEETKMKENAAGKAPIISPSWELGYVSSYKTYYKQLHTTHFNVILAFPSKFSFQLEMCSNLLASQTSLGGRLEQNLTENNQCCRHTSTRLHEHKFHITPLFGSIVHRRITYIFKINIIRISPTSNGTQRKKLSMSQEDMFTYSGIGRQTIW